MKNSYDWRGMPVEFKLQDQKNSSDSTRLAMMYDGAGRRISKTLLTKPATATSWETVKVTHYTGIGTEIREEFHNGSRERVSVVVNMPQSLGRYKVADASQPADDNASRTFEWYLKNHLGSTMVVYGTGFPDPLGISPEGELRAAYDYRSFGEQLDLLVFTRKVTENFTGKERDDETKLNYFGARYLDPMLGMWISVDPLREFQSSYMYGPANPMNGFDNGGLSWEFAQNTGRLTHIDDKTGARKFIAFGYAGNVKGFNNSKLQHVGNVGPLPQGHYTINLNPQTRITVSGSRVTDALVLTPDKNNEMFDRSGFLIHGRTASWDFGASNGCAIFDYNIREKIWKSGDAQLDVVPDAIEDMNSNEPNGRVFYEESEVLIEWEE